MADRKGKNFSVSFKEQELEIIGDFLEKKKQQVGFKLSRNDYIRRASVAMVTLLDPKNKKSVIQVFSEID